MLCVKFGKGEGGDVDHENMLGRSEVVPPAVLLEQTSSWLQMFHLTPRLHVDKSHSRRRSIIWLPASSNLDVQLPNHAGC